MSTNASAESSSWTAQEMTAVGYVPRLLTPLVPEVDYERFELPAVAYDFARKTWPIHEEATAAVRERMCK